MARSSRPRRSISRPARTKHPRHVTLPLEVRNETRRIAIDGDGLGGRRAACSAPMRGASRWGSSRASNLENRQPLLSDLYYLKRALAPYADVHEGTIADELARNDSVLVLADVGKISGADHDASASFVANGGVLLRFAGARMTTNTDDLVPVKLRVGGRYLGGALAWAAPQHLAPFPDASPFRGLAIPAEVTVSRQVLAEPSVELGERTWARLADGTPLVTAAPRDKGWIVLFHVTASPAGRRCRCRALCRHAAPRARSRQRRAAVRSRHRRVCRLPAVRDARRFRPRAKAVAGSAAHPRLRHRQDRGRRRCIRPGSMAAKARKWRSMRRAVRPIFCRSMSARPRPIPASARSR